MKEKLMVRLEGPKQSSDLEFTESSLCTHSIHSDQTTSSHLINPELSTIIIPIFTGLGELSNLPMVMRLITRCPRT